MKKLSDISNLQKTILESQKLQDHFNTSEMFKALAESQKLQDHFNTSEMFKALTESRKIQNQFKYSELFNAINESQRISNSFASDFLDRINMISQETRNVDFIVNTDGTISSEDVTFKVPDVEDIIESCLSVTPATRNLSREILLDTFFKNIAKQHPIITNIIVYIVLQFLINIFANKFSSEPQHFDQTNLIRQIKKEVQTVEVNAEFLNEYRFVSTSSLNVRRDRSVNSVCIGILHFAQMVHIIQKNKNWTLIEYHSKDDENYIKGWVFTRYIKRFE